MISRLLVIAVLTAGLTNPVCADQADSAAVQLPFAVTPGAYANPAFGFRLALPGDWSLYQELRRPDQSIVSFGLPGVWSELEQESIENAVAVIAYCRPDIASVEDLIATETGRIADMLISQEEVLLDFGRARLFETERQGNRYRSLNVFRWENGIGYALSFTATPGTYDINSPRFLDFLKTVEFFPPDTLGLTVYPTYFDAAIALSRTPDPDNRLVKAALENETRDHPAHFKAFYWLGILELNDGNCRRSVTLLDSAQSLTDGLQPRLFLYKARALHALGEDRLAYLTIRGMWALFQGDPQQEAEWEQLMAELEASLDTLGFDTSAPDSTPADSAGGK